MNFILNDDTTISSILNGNYLGTPDGHSVYVSYPLSGLLSLLYRILPRVPWFTLFLLGCYLFAFAAIFSTIYKKVLKAGTDYGKNSAYKNASFLQWGSILLSASLLLSLFLPQMLVLHYTVSASVLCSAALFLTVMGESFWLPGLALALGFCVRKDVFLLSLPFFGVALLWRLLREPKRRKKTAFTGVIAVLISVFFIGINSFCYRSPEWQHFFEYNRVRTDLYDYTWFAPYEDIPETYERYGVSKEQYEIVNQYALGLSSELDPDFLRTIQAASSEGLWKEPADTAVKRVMLTYRDWILKEFHEPFTYIAIAMYLCLIIVLLQKRQFLLCLLTVCLGIGRSMIWMYLLWRGRFPERVIMYLLILELILLLGMFLDTLGDICRNGFTKKETSRKSFFLTGYQLLLSILLIICTLFLSGQSLQTQKEKTVAQQEWNQLRTYFREHSDETFLMDCRTMGAYTSGIWSSTMMEPNAFMAGGWLTASPLMQERFQILGAVDGGEAIATLPTVHYITAASDYSWLQDYICTRYPDTHIVEESRLCIGEKTFFILSAE